MKFLHIADLHIGKRIYGFPLIEDQRHMLCALVDMAREKSVDAVLIAGDIYDRTVPPGAAVALLDDFLTALLVQNISVFMIAGNHDQPERLQFASRMLEKNGLYIAAVYAGMLPRTTLKDEYGDVAVTMLPYIGPAQARAFFPETPIDTHADAVRAVLLPPEKSKRNVLVAHQYVVPGAQGADAEQVPFLGGLDAIKYTLFDGYDYVALGHVHRRYPVGRAQIRYAGAPLKYAFDDALEQKGALYVEMDGAGNLTTEFLPVAPLRDMRQIEGPLEAILTAAEASDDFLSVVLTDENEAPDAMRRLRAYYPNALQLSYHNSRTSLPVELFALPERQNAYAAFAAFFQMQNGRPLDEKSGALIQERLLHIGEEEER